MIVVSDIVLAGSVEVDTVVETLVSVLVDTLVDMLVLTDVSVAVS